MEDTVLSSNDIRIAAVVATHNRPYDLANRSLRSIESQTRQPDYLIIVDDSDPKYKRINKNIKTDFASRWVKTVYLGNYRSPGASGSWNTALAWLHRYASDVYVAILDDDDSWEPTYLEKCSNAVISKNLDMVAAGIIRHDDKNINGRPQSIPDNFNSVMFLKGNPHIQGSNLFLRLHTILNAGGFDESLTSTTDRDLCIRLADLDYVRYGTINEHLVHHYAESSRTRLSSYGSDVKRMGLTGFYKKYGSRMSESQKEAFKQRCINIFGSDPTKIMPSIIQDTIKKSEVKEYEDLFLLIGSISSTNTSQIDNLLNDLCKLNKRTNVKMKILILENSGYDNQKELKEVINKFSKDKMKIKLIDYEQQMKDVKKGIFGYLNVNQVKNKSIAVSRTMIQHYLYLGSQIIPGTVIWILDDDSRIDNLLYTNDSKIIEGSGDIINNIKRLKKERIAIALGTVTGDPPLPFTSCIRTQMVDLYHNLEWIAKLSPNVVLPNRLSENMENRHIYHDYYYDLSRDETDQLETPFWYIPESERTSVKNSFKDMITALPKIKMGKQLFRPLIYNDNIDPMRKMIPSIHRGGNTFILHPSSLRDFPNIVPNIGGKDTRRSDMIWCLLNRFITGRKIIEVPIPVRQDRSGIKEGKLDFDKLIEDIQGYALYSSLQDVFLENAKERQLIGKKTYGKELITFNIKDIDFALNRFKKYIDERTLAFELSFLRINGLLNSFQKYYDKKNKDKYWWLDDQYNDIILEFKNFVNLLKEDYSEDRLIKFRQMVENVDENVIRNYYSQLEENIYKYKSSQPIITDEFKSYAELIIKKEFIVDKLECLGYGEEGIVFKDKVFIYKYFYHWKKHISEEQFEFLTSLINKFKGLKTIYPIKEVRRFGQHSCIVYPYEQSTKYKGGYLNDILKFLKECKSAGIIYRNIHPDNFIVTENGLKLIDYGADIIPFNDNEYIHMCHRAFLMYRFYHRKDLKEIMRKALSDDNIPELYRFEHFLRALDKREIHEILYPRLIKIIHSYNPKSVFDYGCGKGKISEELANNGINVTGFDIDEKLIKRCKDYDSQVNYYGPKELNSILNSSKKWDLVLCSIVLCTIKDKDDLRKILKNIRRLVSNNGRVVVAVCNPFYSFIEKTEIQRRVFDSNFLYDEIFSFKKYNEVNNTTREDIHRPYSYYIREFKREGLEIEHISETNGSDIDNLVYASDFLMFQLKPNELKNNNQVSLLIKTCAMEWKFIEHWIKHLVNQLEGPLTFLEKVVVTDSYAQEFLRQYESPNGKAHKEVLERLLKEGIIDRIVYAPYDEEIIRKTNKKWFGKDELTTHAKNGQNIYPTLYGIEKCQGKYVLQMDSDLFISRLDKKHDFLNDMIEVLESDPKSLTVSFNICHDKSIPYTHTGKNGDWRVEVRNCLFHRDRLFSILPIENMVNEDRFELPWHRALDRFISQSEYGSYRGGDKKSFFIHVLNDRKKDLDDIYSIMDRVEESSIYQKQNGLVDLVGNWRDWSYPKRDEQFVFIICSRNVHPGKFKECWDSVLHQNIPDWGAVIVDGASENGLGGYIETLVGPYKNKVTFIRDKEKRGLLYSTWCAITQYCSNKDSVIITLDADDALLGPLVLDRVKAEYDQGADVTVGSMLRTDKDAKYIPDFINPREKRGGNVWQHLRTFKKYLFDRIDVEDLKIDGEWVDVATDWLFMLPIVEMAENPRYIKEKLYYYEPSEEKIDRRKIREDIIAKIVAKPPYSKVGN